jgi:hypothetical protein
MMSEHGKKTTVTTFFFRLQWPPGGVDLIESKPIRDASPGGGEVAGRHSQRRHEAAIGGCLECRGRGEILDDIEPSPNGRRSANAFA